MNSMILWNLLPMKKVRNSYSSAWKGLTENISWNYSKAYLSVVWLQSCLCLCFHLSASLKDSQICCYSWLAITRLSDYSLKVYYILFQFALWAYCLKFLLTFSHIPLFLTMLFGCCKHFSAFTDDKKLSKTANNLFLLLLCKYTWSSLSTTSSTTFQIFPCNCMMLGKETEKTSQRKHHILLQIKSSSYGHFHLTFIINR